MCRTLSLLAATLLSTSICGALHAAVSSGPPATQPVNSTVLVLPIAAPQGTDSWVGKAIQQDMAVDLTQMTRARVLAPAGRPATDSQEALRAGHEAGAAYVVYAQSQNAGNQLRVSGQVLNVEDGNALSAIKATAPMDELFPLEDALAVQVARALPASLAVRVPGTQPSVTPVAPQSSLSEPSPPPQYESVQSPSPEYYSTTPMYVERYPYYYNYPGYWAYGWWGPGVIIAPHFWHDHDWDDDHDWDRRPFVSPHMRPGFGGGRGGGGHTAGPTRGGGGRGR